MPELRPLKPVHRRPLFFYRALRPSRRRRTTSIRLAFRHPSSGLSSTQIYRLRLAREALQGKPPRASPARQDGKTDSRRWRQNCSGTGLDLVHFTLQVAPEIGADPFDRPRLTCRDPGRSRGSSFDPGALNTEVGYDSPTARDWASSRQLISLSFGRRTYSSGPEDLDYLPPQRAGFRAPRLRLDTARTGGIRGGLNLSGIIAQTALSLTRRRRR